MEVHKFKNKNLVFYSRNDKDSQFFLAELQKNDSLKKQFIMIDQENAQINIPAAL